MIVLLGLCRWKYCVLLSGVLYIQMWVLLSEYSQDVVNLRVHCTINSLIYHKVYSLVISAHLTTSPDVPTRLPLTLDHLYQYQSLHWGQSVGEIEVITSVLLWNCCTANSENIALISVAMCAHTYQCSIGKFADWLSTKQLLYLSKDKVHLMSYVSCWKLSNLTGKNTYYKMMLCNF